MMKSEYLDERFLMPRAAGLHRFDLVLNSRLMIHADQRDWCVSRSRLCQPSQLEVRS